MARTPGLADIVIEDSEKETRAYLDKETTLLKEEGAKVTSIMREGPIPEVILKVADEIHADMIAMSTHGRSGIQRWLMGSVADRVVHHAHIPVMLVHPFSEN
jgi:nucleotide-binding universal stress UspA family protein